MDAPVILGVLRVAGDQTSFRQEVLDDDFRGAAEAKGLTVATPKASLKRLATEVADADAVVIAWSKHELDVFQEFGGRFARDVLSAAYRNAIPLAKRWRKAMAPDWTPPEPRVRYRGRHTLDAYMAKLDFVVPTAFGPYQTGQRLRDVRQMLAARDGDYAALTPTVKGKWTKVLRHNEYDCRGMHHVCLTAARLSATSSTHDHAMDVERTAS